MKNKKNKRAKFYVEPESLLIRFSMMLMCFSFFLLLVGTLSLWNNSYFILTQIVLPLCVSVLFILCLRYFGKKLFWLSTIPALLCAAYFVIKSMGYESSLQTILSIVLYILAAAVYTGTAIGLIRTKWPLAAFFGLPLLYHVFILDMEPFVTATIGFAEGLEEMSELSIMLAYLCVALGLKKKPDFEIGPESGLPKMAEPVVIINKKEQPNEEPHEAAQEQPQSQNSGETTDNEEEN